MTIRPRAARALLEARTKLRDIAAATHAQAAAVRDRSHLALVEEQQHLDDFLDEATTLVGDATSVYDLDRVGEDTGVHKLAIVDAATRHQKASEDTNVTAAKLRDSARRLASAEAIVEKIQTDRAKSSAQAEQRANDDIASQMRMR